MDVVYKCHIGDENAQRYFDTHVSPIEVTIKNAERIAKETEGTVFFRKLRANEPFFELHEQGLSSDQEQAVSNSIKMLVLGRQAQEIDANDLDLSELHTLKEKALQRALREEAEAKERNKAKAVADAEQKRRDDAAAVLKDVLDENQATIADLKKKIEQFEKERQDGLIAKKAIRIARKGFKPIEWDGERYTDSPIGEHYFDEYDELARIRLIDDNARYELWQDRDTEEVISVVGAAGKYWKV